MKKQDFNPDDSNAKEWDLVEPDTEMQCLQYLHGLMDDVKRIYSQLTSSQYALDRFGSNTTDERQWRINASKAYEAKNNRIKLLKSWLRDNGHTVPAGQGDIEQRIYLTKPLSAPAFEMDVTPNGKHEPEPKQPEKAEYDSTAIDIVYEQCLNRLRLAREGLGLTQDAASEMAGLNSNVIGGYETGSSMIRLHTFLRLCDVYNVDPAYILTGKRGKLPKAKIDKHFADLTELRDILTDIIDNNDIG